MNRSRWSLAALAVPLAAALAAPPSSAQWEIASADGKSSIKLGVLLQPQAELLENATADQTEQNLFLRRMRLVFGGKVMDRVTFFVETDSPNLGKGTATGGKDEGNVYIQDAFVTYTASDAFMIDAGLLLVPVSYNTQQSAGTLLPIDYGPYSFLHSAPTQSRVGRDYGFQLRGYPAGKHFEYRAGLLQGVRGTAQNNAFRYFARAAWHVFEPQTGMFYAGPSLGKKKVLDVGASYDAQKDYRSISASVFYDQPVGEGDGLTLQADWISYDGDVTLPSLPKQSALLFEAAWYFHGAKLAPFVQWASRDFDAPGTADEDKTQIGLAWYPGGHRYDVKLAAARLGRDGSPNRTQIVLQAQIWAF